MIFQTNYNAKRNNEETSDWIMYQLRDEQNYKKKIMNLRNFEHG